MTSTLTAKQQVSTVFCVCYLSELSLYRTCGAPRFFGCDRKGPTLARRFGFQVCSPQNVLKMTIARPAMDVAAGTSGARRGGTPSLVKLFAGRQSDYSWSAWADRATSLAEEVNISRPTGIPCLTLHRSRRIRSIPSKLF